jgi:C1A family cysteine protease
MSRKHMKYGWRPDSRDPRDLHFAAFMPTSDIEMPPVVDLSPGCSKVENQQDLGSCTANALAGAVEYLEIKQSSDFIEASRLFIYYNERELEGTVCADAGAELRDGIKTLVTHGVCSETLLPYDPSKFTRKPSKKCYAEALDHRIQKYYKIASLEGMKQCLALGYPFSFGFAVFDSFESKEVAKTGMMPIPNPEAEELLGGHAVLSVGYDDEKRKFKIRNSWGERWGDEGYFYMDYSFIADKRFCSDFWVVTRQM